MKTTHTVNCTCQHTFQDKIYGIGRRLANLVTKSIKPGSNTVEYRCTVCKKTHSVNKGK